MPPKVIMRSLTISEIAGVTKPAMGGAIVSFIKVAPDEFEKLKPKKGESQPDYMARFMSDAKMMSEYPDKKQRAAVAYSYFGKCAALTTVAGDGEDSHTHLIRLDGYDGPLMSGMTSYDGNHSHPWVMGENDLPVIGEAAGHNHTIATVGKSAAGTPSEEPMPDEIVTLKAQHAEMTKALAAATALLALSDPERAYAKGLDEKGRDAFLAADAGTRAGLLKAAGDANPVVFTSATGETFRKNDDPRTIAMAKRLDEQSAALAKSEAFATQARFEKRAVDEIPNLPGDVPTRAAILKALDGIADEALRAKALETLKAQNADMATAMRARGTAAGGSAGSAEDKLDALAKKLASEKNISYAKAYDLALSSPEGAVLYAEYTKSRE